MKKFMPFVLVIFVASCADLSNFIGSSDSTPSGPLTLGSYYPCTDNVPAKCRTSKNVEWGEVYSFDTKGTGASGYPGGAGGLGRSMANFKWTETDGVITIIYTKGAGKRETFYMVDQQMIKSSMGKDAQYYLKIGY